MIPTVRTMRARATSKVSGTPGTQEPACPSEEKSLIRRRSRRMGRAAGGMSVAVGVVGGGVRGGGDPAAGFGGKPFFFRF